jgi:hypothetical protein
MLDADSVELTFDQTLRTRFLEAELGVAVNVAP